MTLSEMYHQVTRALAALEDQEQDRAVRANSAYALLSRVAHSRHDLPDPLRPEFDALWAAYHRAEPRIAEVLAQRARFSLFSDAEFDACHAGTRAFAGSLEREIARTAEPGAETSPADEPELSEENGGRAAAEE